MYLQNISEDHFHVLQSMLGDFTKGNIIYLHNNKTRKQGQSTQ